MCLTVKPRPIWLCLGCSENWSHPQLHGILYCLRNSLIGSHQQQRLVNSLKSNKGSPVTTHLISPILLSLFSAEISWCCSTCTCASCSTSSSLTNAASSTGWGRWERGTPWTSPSTDSTRGCGKVNPPFLVARGDTAPCLRFEWQPTRFRLSSLWQAGCTLVVLLRLFTREGCRNASERIEKWRCLIIL